MSKTKKQLSPQEKRTLVGYIKGKKNKEIAVLLGVNEKTVSNYALKIREKVGANKDDNIFIVIMRACQKGYVRHDIILDLMLPKQKVHVSEIPHAVHLSEERLNELQEEALKVQADMKKAEEEALNKIKSGDV
jgi:DNA-binding CsgD family transcriptional regulator